MPRRLLVLSVPAALLAVLGGLTLTGSLAATDLLDPGPLVRYALPLARTVHDLAAALTVGLLVLTATALPGGKDVTGPARTVRTTALRHAAIAATTWCAAAVATLVLTYADVAGIPLGSPGFGAQFWFFLTELDLGRSLAVSALAVVLLAIGCWLARSLTTVGILAALSLAALLPLGLAGHASGTNDHSLAVDGLVLHLLGVCVWAGGLAALLLVHRGLGEHLRTVAGRFSTLAGACFVVVAASGVVNAWLRVGSWDAIATRYGLLVVVKSVALELLGIAGWRQRARVLPRLGDGSRAFARLAATEVVLMAVTFGASVALSRSAPPVPQTATGPGAQLEALLGFPAPPAFSPVRLFTEWHLSLFWALVAACLAGFYLAGVARLRRRGDRWPVGSTIPWVLGCALLVYLTSGAPALYGKLTFSAHMAQHMGLTMVVPPLLVLGAPVTLTLRAATPRRDGSRGLREWALVLTRSPLLRLLGNPVVTGVLFAGSLYAFYYTGLFQQALLTHTGHMVMTAHFLLTGYLFCWVLIGRDPGPHRPPYPLRLVLLLVTLSFHAFFGVALMSGSEVLAPAWWHALGNTDDAALLADQHTGGGVAWGAGDIPTAVLAVGLAIAWARSDEREARRTDRKGDRDGGVELAAYNAHLAELARREE
ncbi:cytochrome c oxidase assembly protein [Kineococcus sp. GCM10028916]|uniref:cytochrome c oxidase assembly protein n=1 Tax=Kineococcus sp. GCM10028916 TaxID=3273394 RepID=UPI0036378E87